MRAQPGVDMGVIARPRFELLTQLPADAVTRRVGRRLKRRPCPICGLSMPERIELHVPSDRQHFWSPELVVEVEHTDTGARLLGRFGPHPHVWTMYMALVAATAIGNLVAISCAYAQWVMGESPSALWCLLASAALLSILYLVSVLGQGFGEAQMRELRGFLEATLDEESGQSESVA